MSRCGSRSGEYTAHPDRPQCRQYTAGSASRGTPLVVDSASGAASPYQPNAGFIPTLRTTRLSGRTHRCVSTCKNGRSGLSGLRATDSSATKRARAAAVRSGDRCQAAPQL